MGFCGNSAWRKESAPVNRLVVKNGWWTPWNLPQYVSEAQPPCWRKLWNVSMTITQTLESETTMTNNWILTAVSQSLIYFTYIYWIIIIIIVVVISQGMHWNAIIMRFIIFSWLDSQICGLYQNKIECDRIIKAFPIWRSREGIPLISRNTHNIFACCHRNTQGDISTSHRRWDDWAVLTGGQTRSLCLFTAQN